MGHSFSGVMRVGCETTPSTLDEVQSNQSKGHADENEIRPRPLVKRRFVDPLPGRRGHDVCDVIDRKAVRGAPRSQRHGRSRDRNRSQLRASRGISVRCRVEVGEFDGWQTELPVRSGHEKIGERLASPNYLAVALDRGDDVRIISLEDPGGVKYGRLQRCEISGPGDRNLDLHRFAHFDLVPVERHVHAEGSHRAVKGGRSTARKCGDVDVHGLGRKLDRLELASEREKTLKRIR